jgi:hypothetical protein
MPEPVATAAGQFCAVRIAISKSVVLAIYTVTTRIGFKMKQISVQTPEIAVLD